MISNDVTCILYCIYFIARIVFADTCDVNIPNYKCDPEVYDPIVSQISYRKDFPGDRNEPWHCTKDLWHRAGLNEQINFREGMMCDGFYSRDLDFKSWDDVRYNWPFEALTFLNFPGVKDPRIHVPQFSVLNYSQFVDDPFIRGYRTRWEQVYPESHKKSPFSSLGWTEEDWKTPTKNCCNPNDPIYSDPAYHNDDYSTFLEVIAQRFDNGATVGPEMYKGWHSEDRLFPLCFGSTQITKDLFVSSFEHADFVYKVCKKDLMTLNRNLTQITNPQRYPDSIVMRKTMSPEHYSQEYLEELVEFYKCILQNVLFTPCRWICSDYASTATGFEGRLCPPTKLPMNASSTTTTTTTPWQQMNCAIRHTDDTMPFRIYVLDDPTVSP